MKRAIALILLVLFPMQLYALDYQGFGTDDSVKEFYFVPRGPDRQQEQQADQLTEKIQEEPPKASETVKSGTNWWLWGGIGLAVVAGSVAAAASGGGKGGGSTSSGGGGASTTTVTGSW